MLLVSLSAPAGELGQGPIANVEIMRAAMSLSTFREVTELFNRTLAEIEQADRMGAETRPSLSLVGEKRH